jgi:hypothetical protein
MNIINQVAYLRTSREFPEDPHMLTVEVNKTYVDIAAAVNNRIIGLFPTNRPAITGESWFPISQRQQTLRQIYIVTPQLFTMGIIPHGIGKNYASIAYFTRIWGEFTDGTNWYGIIGGSNVAIAGQISIYVDDININLLKGAGAPAFTKGIIVLEWMSQI